MADNTSPSRPERIGNPPLPPVPTVDESDADAASVAYSHYRTGLSHHRTELSEHRTDLSEYRTDLSGNRTTLSMRRTGMSVHRTRMSADRTLMSVMRTALSLIAFGFTLHEAFKKAFDAGAIHSAQSPRNFSIALILLGTFLLIGGIVRHVQFATGLRKLRGEMIGSELIFGESAYPVSLILIAAMILVLIGLLAFISIVLDVSFFSF